MSKEKRDDTCEDCGDDCNNTQNKHTLGEDDWRSIKRDTWPLYVGILVAILVLVTYITIVH